MIKCDMLYRVIMTVSTMASVAVFLFNVLILVRLEKKL